jgi:DNA-binding GntR family transcriptional regulator
MSRTPVRDALRRLAMAGIVEPAAGGGYRQRRVTLREVEELHELLALLEPVAAEMAASRGPAEIDALLNSAGASGRDATPIANTRFHVAIAEASGNQVLARVIETLHERLAAEHRLMEPGDDTDGLSDGHELIVAAIRTGDARKAAESARRHIGLGRDVLARRVRDGGATGE